MKTNRICAIYTRVSTEEQNPQIQVDELKKGNKVSINKIANNWIMYYLGYNVKNYYPENWEKI